MSFLIMNVTYDSFGRQLDETNQSIEMDPHWCYRNDEPTMTVTVIGVLERFQAHDQLGTCRMTTVTTQCR